MMLSDSFFKEIYCSLNQDNIITIIGFVLTILIFVFERVVNYRREVKEAKHNWFLNVILSPNLQELNGFYSEMKRSLVGSVEELKVKKDELVFAEFLLLKSDKIRGFKEFRKSYFNNFSSMISSYSLGLASDFDNKINELDDIYTTTLDDIQDDSSNDLVDLSLITSRVYQNKSDVTALLFREVKKKSLIGGVKKMFYKLLSFFKNMFGG